MSPAQIERTRIEVNGEAITHCLGTTSAEVMLQLHALFKQGTVGEMGGSRPGPTETIGHELVRCPRA